MSQAATTEYFDYPSASSHFTALFSSGQYSDVTLKHGEIEYKCHKIILAYKSEYFAKLFEKEKGKVVVLDFEDQDGVFPLVLQFLYQGGGDFSQKVINSKNVVAIKLAANFFQLEELSKSVAEYLGNNLNNESAFTLLHKAVQFNDEVLMLKSVEYIANNFATLIDEFNACLDTLPKTIFFNILSQPGFSASVRAPSVYEKYIHMLREFIEKHEVKKNIDLTKQLLQATYASQTLTVELAIDFLNYYTNSQEMSNLAKTEALKCCFPVIASDFYKLGYNTPKPAETKPAPEEATTPTTTSEASTTVSAPESAPTPASSPTSKGIDLLTLPADIFSEIMSSDDLVLQTEDDVLDLVLKYLNQHESMTLAEQQKCMQCVRYTFLSFEKLQNILKDLKNTEKQVFKAMSEDLMEALCARLLRSESTSATIDLSSFEKANLRPRRQRMFVYQSDFDKNGIMYWIGCIYGTSNKYENPALKELVKVTASQGCEAGKVSDLISYTPVSCNLLGGANTNVTVELLNMEVMPTKYTLRHTEGRDAECLRHWKFMGSKDGTNFVCLKEHKDDQAINGKSASASWDVSVTEYYRYFRIEQTGNNSSNSQYMSMAGFELYGLCKLDTAIFATKGAGATTKQ